MCVSDTSQLGCGENILYTIKDHQGSEKFMKFVFIVQYLHF